MVDCDEGGAGEGEEGGEERWEVKRRVLGEGVEGVED